MTRLYGQTTDMWSVVNNKGVLRMGDDVGHDKIPNILPLNMDKRSEHLIRRR